MEIRSFARIAKAALPPRNILILPGWLGSGPQHWQTKWEGLYGYQRVEQSDWEEPKRRDWVAALDNVACNCNGEIAIVAHSLGCWLAAHWARSSEFASKVRFAMLVSLPDIRDPRAPKVFNEFRLDEPFTLPFPSLAVLSNNDHYGEMRKTMAICQAWGSEILDIGACGHINADSGLGAWDEGHDLFIGRLHAT